MTEPRHSIAALDRRLTAQLLEGYAAAWQRLRWSLDRLTARIEAAGEDASSGWLLRQEELRTLQRGVGAEVDRLSTQADGATTRAQAEAVTLAQTDARSALLRRATFRPPPADVARELVGHLGDGRPLRALLDTLGPEAARQVRDALVSGVVLGESPGRIARRTRRAFGGSAVRAVTIARTETMRAFRESTRQTFQANAQEVRAWRWKATAGTRTCAFCWAMHGSEHPLSESLASHPNCRCVMEPVLHDEQRAPATGPERFDRLSPERQRLILGPAKHAAYEAGDLGLEDLVGTRRDREWGRVGWEKSLTSVVGAERARELIRGART